MRLAIRVARELHMPINQVLEMPTTELDLWALIFSEEYYQLHPEEKPVEDDASILGFKNLMGK